jgi:hypothetical protein
MAQKESLDKFVKNFNKLDEKTTREAMAGWNKNTLLTMVRGQFYSPVKTGDLQGSARRIQAKITPEGIKSVFIFAKPYAFKMERGINPFTGKKLNINTSINPNARSGYAKQAMDEHEDLFVSDLSKAVSKAWR